jgi:hypothetical protein
MWHAAQLGRAWQAAQRAVEALAIAPCSAMNPTR